MSKRTLVMVIIIVSLMTIIGTITGIVAYHEIQKTYNKYDEAILATTSEQFINAINNKQNVIASDTLMAVDPVTDEYLEGDYISISRRHETYVMDTRVVTTMINGKSQTRSELYYHWKLQGQDHSAATKLDFMGYHFDAEEFDLRADRKDTWNVDTDERYIYSAISNNRSGTIFIDFEHNMKVLFYENKTVEEVIRAQRNYTWLVVFVIVWISITIGSAVVLIMNDRATHPTESKTIEDDDDYENF